MRFLTYSGNNLIHIQLPDDASIYYPRPPIPGIKKRDIPQALRNAFDHPLGMPPLRELVSEKSKILIAFDDNCQPFPITPRPDLRQIMLETLLPLLYSFGVKKENIQLKCAVALHRKMKKYELAYMVGPRIMKEFYPEQLDNSDAEDMDNIVTLGETEQGEIVDIDRAVVESDLVIYLDTVPILLNGGHKSVAVGLGTYRTIAYHHNPAMTEDVPHVMQPSGSNMHAVIERLSRIVQKHAKIMVLEAPTNGATYPFYLKYISKPPRECNIFEKVLNFLTPPSLKLLPEPVRSVIFKSIRSPYLPMEINAGAIDEVHARTVNSLNAQLKVAAPKQVDTMIFGLPDLSPYAVGARLNPVLVVSDVLGYVFNWFYTKPLVKKGGVVIILNPGFEIFHHEYHVPYRKFFEEVLAVTADPFKMKELFQEQYAHDPYLIDCYRNKYAYHGFHPFTVWNWATYPLRYLSKVILVGPPDDRVAKRLGVAWAPDMPHALDMAREASGGSDVAALSIPPFMYFDVQ